MPNKSTTPIQRFTIIGYDPPSATMSEYDEKLPLSVEAVMLVGDIPETTGLLYDTGDGWKSVPEELRTAARKAWPAEHARREAAEQAKDAK